MKDQSNELSFKPTNASSRYSKVKKLYTVIVALLFSLAFAVFYIWSTSQNTTLPPSAVKTSSKSALSSAATNQTPIINYMEDWNVWLSPDTSKYLRFKYPSDWKYYTDTSGVGYDDTGNGSFGFDVRFQGNGERLPLEEFVNGITDFTKNASKTPIQVGDRTGLLIRNDLNNNYYTTIYVAYDDETVLEINPNGNTDSQVNQDVLKRILLTFEFNPDQTGDNCLVNGVKFLNGQSIPAEFADKCNLCKCSNGGLICTKKKCSNMIQPTVVPVD